MAIPFLGAPNDPNHERLVRELELLYLYYEEALSTPFQTIVGFWRLFCGEQPDFRRRDELWRSNIFVPYPSSGVQVKAAQISDLMNSAEPLIQCGWGDESKQRQAETLFIYQNSMNGFFPKADQTWIDLLVQGSAAWKIGWVERLARVWQNWDASQEKDLQAAIQDAVQRGAPPPPQDPIGFENWRKLVNQAQLGGQEIPERAATGFKTIKTYCGPGFKECSIFDLRFDPYIEDFADQPVVYHRMTKPNAWVRDMVARGKWDEESVEDAIANTPYGRFTEWELQVAAMQGISSDGMDNPIYQSSGPDAGASEVLEILRPGTNFPYCVMLNRRAIVNKTPWIAPNSHGQHPYAWFKNIPIRGQALGMSDYKLTQSMYLEMNKIRGLRIDSITLGVLPLLARNNQSGTRNDAALFLTPGQVWDVNGKPSDALAVISKLDPNLQWAFQEEASLKNDIDEANSTQANVRGSTSTVGRVTATEQQGRFEQAQKRNKCDASRIEQYAKPYVVQSIWLWFQEYAKTAGKLLLRGGKDLKSMGKSGISGVPGYEYSKEDFLAMLEMDLQFRGASNALNRELAAQQLQGLSEAATNMRALRPVETRMILEKCYTMLGFKNPEMVFTDAGKSEVEIIGKGDVAQAQLVIAQAAQQMMALMNPQPQPGAPPGQPGQAPQPGQGQLPPGQEGAPPQEPQGPDQLPMGPGGELPPELQQQPQ